MKTVYFGFGFRFLGFNFGFQDGFYDAGVLGCNSKFVPISELSEMEVNDKRPVLLVHYEDGEKEEGETQTQLNVDETPKKNEREASGKSQGSKGKKSSKKQKEKKEEMKIEEIHSKPSSLQMTNQTSNMSICKYRLAHKLFKRDGYEVILGV